VCVLLAACAPAHGPSATASPGRAPVDAPDHFLVLDIKSGVTLEPSPDMACRNPLVDPKTGTQIRLLRSSEGHGDYAVTDGRYGVGAHEVLRIACATGKPVGIFPSEGD